MPWASVLANAHPHPQRTKGWPREVMLPLCSALAREEQSQLSRGRRDASVLPRAWLLFTGLFPVCPGLCRSGEPRPGRWVSGGLSRGARSDDLELLLRLLLTQSGEVMSVELRQKSCAVPQPLPRLRFPSPCCSGLRLGRPLRSGARRGAPRGLRRPSAARVAPASATPRRAPPAVVPRSG